MDSEETKYMCGRYVLPSLIGIAEVCIFSGVASILKGIFCIPKYGYTLNKPHRRKSQQCLLLGVWDADEELRGSCTQLWRQELFSDCKATQKSSSILWKKKQTKKQKPFSCTHCTGKLGLAIPKTESLRRYLYTKSVLVALLTRTRFPDFHLCLASCLWVSVQLTMSLQLEGCLAAHPWEKFRTY